MRALMQTPALLPALTFALTLGATTASSPAFAAGWDTPILFSAEHMGMGGAAISFVDDPSAMFHNPAGLSRTHGLTLMADVSLLTGTITGSPDVNITSKESEQIVSVAPLAGVSYSFNDWFSAGLAFYPVAAAGADYLYEEQGKTVENSTKITFLELSPGVAFKIPGGLRLGAGYRISFLTLDRLQKAGGATAKFDASLSGMNLAGFRVGLQWDPFPELQLGMTYRHKTATDISADTAVYVGQTTSLGTTFVLPSKFGFGMRGNFGSLGVPISLVLDLEYALQSQNKESVFKPGPDAIDLGVVSVFEWSDAVTLRTGLEYSINDTFFFRGGYIYDGKVTQKRYPSAFGTPPAPTHTATLGFGYGQGETWKANVALAYRMGSTTVAQSDLPQVGEKSCPACGLAGDYAIGLMGIYVDFAYSFH